MTKDNEVPPSPQNALQVPSTPSPAVAAAAAPSIMNNRTETISSQQPPPIVQLNPGTVIQGWKIVQKLGEGVFGAVFKCKRADEKNADKNFYAMKIEQSGGQVDFLALEVLIYAALMKNEVKQPHYPMMLARGEWTNCYYLVMTLVGPSLQELRKTREEQKFSMGTALVIARQTLEALSQLHHVGFLHRDIKPANFAIGCGLNDRIIYMLDFGMAGRFVTEENGQQVMRRARKGKIGFRGTLKYASIHAHLGLDLCRGDDIESWFYMICELIKGKLPWNTFNEPLPIFRMKVEARKLPVDGDQPNPKSPRRLLLGGCPRQFGPMLDLITPLKFYDTPGYGQLIDLLNDAVKTTEASISPLDWQKAKKDEQKTPEKKEEKNAKSCIQPAPKKDEQKTPEKKEGKNAKSCIQPAPKKGEQKTPERKKESKSCIQPAPKKGEQKTLEKKKDEQKTPEKKKDEQKTPEKKKDEQKTPEKKKDEQKTPEKKDEQKTPEKKKDEQKTPEKKDEQKATEKKDEQKAPEKKDEQKTEEKKDEQKAPEKKDEQKTEEKKDEQKTEEKMD